MQQLLIWGGLCSCQLESPDSDTERPLAEFEDYPCVYVHVWKVGEEREGGGGGCEEMQELFNAWKSCGEAEGLTMVLPLHVSSCHGSICSMPGVLTLSLLGFGAGLPQLLLQGALRGSQAAPLLPALLQEALVAMEALLHILQLLPSCCQLPLPCLKLACTSVQHSRLCQGRAFLYLRGVRPQQIVQGPGNISAKGKCRTMLAAMEKPPQISPAPGKLLPFTPRSSQIPHHDDACCCPSKACFKLTRLLQ